MKATLDPLLTRDKTTQSDRNPPEPLVKEKSDSGASDFDDTCPNPKMYRPKTLVGSRIKSQTSQITPPKHVVRSALERRHTKASEAKTASSTAGGEAKNELIQSTEVGLSSELLPQNDPSNDKRASVLPTLKDQRTSGSSSGTHSKSKIPKMSTQVAEAKSLVTSGIADPVDSSKLRKQTRATESLKSPGNKEAKGGQALSGDLSPTKNMHMVSIKHIKEKSKEESNSLNLINQSPTSFLTRKKKCEITETNGTSCKNVSNLKRPKSIQHQGPEQKGVTPDERLETPLSESPKKGKRIQSHQSTFYARQYFNHYYTT